MDGRAGLRIAYSNQNVNLNCKDSVSTPCTKMESLSSPERDDMKKDLIMFNNK